MYLYKCIYYLTVDKLIWRAVVDFRSRKFTFLSLLFMVFCLYNAGYFNQKMKIGIPKPQIATSEVDAQYKINIDPTKPKEQMSYLERFLIQYAMEAKREQDAANGIKPVLMKKGDKVKLKYAESIQGEKPVPYKEVTITVGDNQLKEYIESEVVKLKPGEKAEYKVFDNAERKYIDVKLEIISVEK